jgi:hypothetical protein
MDNTERKDDGYSSRKAIESVPDKALLLPDISPQSPPAGEKAGPGSSREKDEKPDDDQDPSAT